MADDDPALGDEAEGVHNAIASFPTDVPWWEGEWPSAGVASIHDLETWVSYRLTEMIWHQRESAESIRSMGRAFGRQTVKNATRWLERKGRTGVPALPSEDKLADASAIENALNALLRCIRSVPPAEGSTTPPPKSMPALVAADLTERQREVLQALLELDAVSQAQRRNTAEIASRVNGPTASPDNFKQPIADLSRRKLIDTKTGSGGGCWLTDLGRALAVEIAGGKQ